MFKVGDRIIIGDPAYVYQIVNIRSQTENHIRMDFKCIKNPYSINDNLYEDYGYPIESIQRFEVCWKFRPHRLTRIFA